MKIRKLISAIFISSVVAAVMSPEVLTAADVQKFSDIDTSRATQTVLLPMVLSEVARISVPETSTYALVEPVMAPVVTEVRETAPVVNTVVPTPVNRSNVIEVDGKVISLKGTEDTRSNAGTDTAAWYYTKSGKFIYGHNLDYVFGGLKNLKNGDTFTVNYGGETRSYEIADMVIYDYDDKRDILTRNGGGNYMQYVKLGKSSKSVAYDMALMTCHGAEDSQRLVIFANEI